MKWPQWLPSSGDGPGIVLAAVLGALAMTIARLLPRSPFVSEVLIALAIGALTINTPLRHALGLAVPTAEREPDRYASGLRFIGKWVLRLAIIAMGLNVQTSFFGRTELALIGGVLAVS